MSTLDQQIESEFTRRFGNDYLLVKAPGRVNLIGEHTDYNNGFVLPAAVDKHICLAMALNNTGRARFFACDKEESYEVKINDNLQKSGKTWPDYLLGVIDQLQKHGYECEGFDCVFGGNIPIGAGMSSSAALEGGVAFGLNELLGWEIPSEELAQIAQKAENKFVGVQCGIMDQFVSLNGRKDQVMKLDCRSLNYEFYPFRHTNIHFVLCDTQVRRELVSSEYNVRRSQCEEGVEILQRYDESVESLRDVRHDLLQSHREDFDPVVYRRCEYILEENQRVLDACDDLKKGSLRSFGRRMYASHEGLRDKYEVSCEELDILVAKARSLDGVYGARMMGGGFGGCTINLVKSEHLGAFTSRISEHYRERTGREAAIYQTKVSAGTHCIEISETSSLGEL